MRKLCLPIFNRATYARIKSVIHQLDQHKDEFDLTVILSSSLLWEEYGRASEYIKSNHPNTRIIEVEIPQSTRSSLGIATDTANLILRLSDILSSESFDAVIVVADRYETIAAAYAANCFNIPVIHFQGGETTGNIDERIRHAVTKLSDYHFTSTSLASEYIIEMGEHAKRVITVGCPSLDHLPGKSAISKERYCILMYHPVTDHIDKSVQELDVLLDAVTEGCKKHMISCYVYLPNPDPGREKIKDKIVNWCREYNTIFYPIVNEPHEQYLERFRRATFIIGNSSAGLRESSFIGLPSINVGDRQGLRERAQNVIDVFDVDGQKILDAIDHHIEIGRYKRAYVYGDGDSYRRTIEALRKLPFTRKGSITYPLYTRFKELHMGDARYVKHGFRQRSQRLHATKSFTPNGRRLSGKSRGAWARLCRKAIGS